MSFLCICNSTLVLNKPAANKRSLICYTRVTWSQPRPMSTFTFHFCLGALSESGPPSGLVGRGAGRSPANATPSPAVTHCPSDAQRRGSN